MLFRRLLIFGYNKLASSGNAFSAHPPCSTEPGIANKPFSFLHRVLAHAATRAFRMSYMFDITVVTAAELLSHSFLHQLQIAKDILRIYMRALIQYTL